MAFRIKNLAPFFVDVMGITLRTSESVDLLLTQSVAIVKESLLTGDLYDRIQGRQLTIVSPGMDIPYLNLSTTEYAFLTHAGFFQSKLGDDDLKSPFKFSGDGYLLSTMVQSGGVATEVSARGISADGASADGFPIEIGGADASGNVQSLLVNSDGYLMTSTSISIETNSEVEGRVLDGASAVGIKPVVVAGVVGGLAKNVAVTADGYVQIFEVTPVNSNFILETLVNASNQGVTTYYYTVTMDNYRDVSFEMELSTNATVTIEASNDVLFTTPKDITKAGNDLITNSNGYTSFVNLNSILDFDNLNVSYVRVKLVIANSTNSAKIVARKKAL